MLLGSGELGKEVAIELQRFGCEVIAVDRYPNAPAMQVSQRSHVVDMLDGAALRAVVERERPQLIVPEIEAIATAMLQRLEAEGFGVIPTARAARLQAAREDLAARREDLVLPAKLDPTGVSLREALAAWALVAATAALIGAVAGMWGSQRMPKHAAMEVKEV